MNKLNNYKEQIKICLTNYIGDINDNITREKILCEIQDIVQNDYIVVCDNSNNTTDVIDECSLVVDFYINTSSKYARLKLSSYGFDFYE